MQLWSLKSEEGNQQTQERIAVLVQKQSAVEPGRAHVADESQGDLLENSLFLG